ncbi:MAG TPA: hydrolase [Pyrinomonadaceae bacterium]|nr:hydrolase [Pyrinomonadaceae bacterium]
MAHPKILDAKRAALVVVDIQEGFRNAIPEFAVIASRASTAVRGFQVLGLPVVITEQYPKGLGHTAEEIRTALPGDFEVFEKTAFSSCGAAPFVAKLDEYGVRQVVLCGLETHVCVNQTAHDLLELGFDVHLLTDCVCSRFEHDKAAGLAKMKMSGVVPSSIEMALFELMRDAKNASFKEIQALIK